MWLHIPTSVLPLASEDSTSELNEAQAVQLSQSATWRTKSLRLQSWQRVWQKERCLKHLSGLTLRPSMAASGVTKWLESLLAIPASHSAQQDKKKAQTIQETSGQTSSMSSKTSGHNGVSLRTSHITSDLVTFNLSGQALNRLASDVKSNSSRRLTLERRRRVSGSSSSLTQETQTLPVRIYSQKVRWLTPMGSSQVKVKATRKGQTYLFLQSQAGDWPPPFPQAGKVRRLNGSKSKSTIGRLFNPAFVEWLMGFPPGWVCQLPPSTNCSETLSFPIKQRLHGVSSGEQ